MKRFSSNTALCFHIFILNRCYMCSVWFAAFLIAVWSLEQVFISLPLAGVFATGYALEKCTCESRDLRLRETPDSLSELVPRSAPPAPKTV